MTNEMIKIIKRIEELDSIEKENARQLPKLKAELADLRSKLSVLWEINEKEKETTND